MHSFTRHTVTHQVFAGISAIIALLGLLIGLAYFALLDTQQSHDRLYREVLANLQDIPDLRANLNAESLAVGAMLNTDRSRWAYWQEELDRLVRRDDAIIGRLRDRYGGDHEQELRLRKLISIREALNRTRRNELLPAIEAGWLDEAKGLFFGVQLQRHEALREIAGHLEAAEAERAGRLVAQVRFGVRGYLGFFVGLGIVGISLAMLLGLLVSRALTAYVAARDRAEQALREVAADLKEAQRIARVGSWRCRPGNGGIVWSEELYRIFGRDPDSPPPKEAEFHRCFPPESLARLHGAVQRALEAGKPYELELEFIRADGDRRWCIDRGIPDRDAEGRIVGLVGTVQDITERKQGEAMLLGYVQEIEDLYNKAPVGYHSLDPDGAFVRINDTELAWLGYERREVIGRLSFPDVLTPDSAELFRKTFPGFKDSGLAVDREYDLVRKDGTIVSVLLSATAIRDGRGNYVMSRSTLYDVTQYKRTADALRRREAELKEAQRVAQLGSWEWDAAADTVTWSEGQYRVFGLDPALPPPNYYRDHARIYTPDSLARLDVSVRGAMQSGEPYELELEIIHPDGTTRWINTRGEPKRDGAGRIVGLRGTALDITGRRQAEERMRETSQRLSLAVEAAAMGIWDWDVRSGAILWDRRLCEMYGLSEAEPLLYRDWASRVHPDDLPRVEAILRETIAGRQSGYYEFRIALPENGEVRHIQGAATVLGKDGEPTRVVGINFDVTERKHAEEELRRYRDHLEDQVRHRTAELEQAKEAAEAANRAKSIFLANMSHELRTPLNAILGFARLMESAGDLSGAQRDKLEVIDRCGHHLMSLIDDVLEISRIEAGGVTVEPVPFDLADALQGIEEITRSRAEAKGLAFTVEHAGELPAWVEGDAHRLRQVLLNLLSNAVKYTGQGGVVLRVAREDVGIRFEVADTGPGIGPGEQEHIFEAFYQTGAGVAKGEGTGLGLAISRQYVRAMGGELGVRSEPGRGSVFGFSLPMPAAPRPGLPRLRRRVVGLESAEPIRVLVAEDQADNRALLLCLLEAAGFEVRAVDNGAEAVAQFLEWSPRFVWMDMRMPNLDGYAAAMRIRELPGGAAVKIGALTANAFAENRADILACGCDVVVSKPFRDGDLLEAMERLLGLTYRYADIAPALPREAFNPPNLSGLPEAWLAELQAAATALDSDGVEASIARMRTADSDAAHYFQLCLDSFRFDEILRALNPNIPRIP